MIANKIKEIVNHRKESLKLTREIIRKEDYQPLTKKKKPLSQSIKECSNIAIISEIKPASPTLGVIQEHLDIKKISTQMEEAGAVGLSVLTEPNYFQGSYSNLDIAVKNTSIPCLMKDFVVDEIQFKIASRLGATNILLINSIIDLERFYDLAIQYDLEPLIEIHDEKELEDIARLLEIGYSPKLIGVNNRDLQTLKINLDTSRELIPKIKKELREDLIIISESGIQSYGDIINLKRYKVDAFLIGTLIMQSENKTEKIHLLRGKRVD
ncbi:MAG: indole-3-glycerol-phosphate synthase [Promethearchaeia archaeon]